MTQTNSDQLKVAQIYERFAEHVKLYDKPVRNDKWIWKAVDEMTPQQFVYLIHVARDNKFWNIDIESWVDEVCDRDPFWIRQTKDKMKTRHNNNMIWKILMLAREVMGQRIKHANAPINRLFFRETHLEPENIY